VWFERLWKSTLTLMQAVKASLREERGTDALRLVLRSDFIQERNPLLLQSGYCAQQRVLLWMLRQKLGRAKGEDLHALLVSTVEPEPMPVDSGSQSISIRKCGIIAEKEEIPEGVAEDRRLEDDP
jgi:hypothetical protein